MNDANLYAEAMQLALNQARQYLGATAPNPPVGAAGIDDLGNILAVAAHERAGAAHAEARVIEIFRECGEIQDLHTLVVTLEPCNHVGRTPACTRAIIAAGVKRVVFGVHDPNPHVAGGGAESLRAAGVEVIEGVLAAECTDLIRAFRHHALSGKPWVTLKQAFRGDREMIPPSGQKIFTSVESQKFAHELRRRADAIITGSGTILADDPEFTVRHVQDRRTKKRYLVILDRRARVPAAWISRAETRGFTVVRGLDYAQALEYLGQQGALEALVEAGPTLSGEILATGQWNERVEIFAGEPDQIQSTLQAESIENVYRNY